MGQLTQDRFKAVLAKHLLPMLLGATIKREDKSNSGQDAVAWKPGAKCEFYIKPGKEHTYRFVVYRAQKFCETERTLINTFSSVMGEMLSASDRDYFPAVEATLSEHVVARFLASDNHRILLEVFAQLHVWASESYEGAHIRAALGLIEKDGEGNVRIQDVWKEKFSPVLTNGVDTILVCSLRSGHVIGHESLSPQVTPCLAPYRLAPIAKWTSDQKSSLAVALNRNGEILVFQGGQLVFTYRKNHWYYCNHKQVIDRMVVPGARLVREAIYESCLDVSFARTGGCIGIVTVQNGKRVFTGKKHPLKAEDDIRQIDPEKTKTRVGKQIIGKPFHLLDRRLRQELLAIDGAVVVDHTGNVLAIGAIVKVPGGSNEGARAAAAIELGKLGLGIKISQDGPITGFRAVLGKKDAFSLFSTPRTE
jgi:hypothetical protein